MFERLSKYSIFVPLALLFSNALYFVSKQIIFNDDAKTLRLAIQSHSDYRKIFEDFHMILFNALLSLWTWIFGAEYQAAKLLPLLFSAVALVVTYKLVAKMYDHGTALIATLFLSSSPFFIEFSHQLRGYSLFMLFSALSSYCLFRFLAGRESRHYFGYAVSIIFLPYAFMLGLFLIAAQFVFVMGSGLDKSVKNRLFLAQVLAVALYLPVLYQLFIVFRFFAVAPQIYTWLGPVGLSDLVNSLLDIHYSWRGICLSLLPIAVYALFFRQRQGKKSSNSFAVYLLCWAVVPVALLYFYSMLGQSVFMTRGFAPVIIPIAILFSLSFQIRQVLGKIIRTLIVIYVSAVVVSNEYDLFFYNRAFSFDGLALREMNQRLKDKDSETEAYFFPSGIKYTVALFLEKKCLFADDVLSCLLEGKIKLVDPVQLVGSEICAKHSCQLIGGEFGDSTDLRSTVEALGSAVAVEEARVRGFHVYNILRQ